MKNTILALLFTVIAGCGGQNENYHNATGTTASFIEKGAVFSNQGNETTPVIFNGQLLYVSDFIGPDGACRTRVFLQSDGTMIYDARTDLCLISALVNNGTLYVFGKTEGGQQIDMISTVDLVNWTPSVTVFIPPSGTGQMWNNSVATDPTGFVMAYEIGGGGNFNVKFAHSSDLLNWTPIGGQYDIGYVTACPTIRNVDGEYFVFFTAHYSGGTDGHGVFMTNTAKSPDLVNFTFSPTTVISPLDGGDVSNNSSDMDMVEFNGQVRIVYWNISQWGVPIPNTGIREATFNGTLSEFVAKFF